MIVNCESVEVSGEERSKWNNRSEDFEGSNLKHVIVIFSEALHSLDSELETLFLPVHAAGTAPMTDQHDQGGQASWRRS